MLSSSGQQTALLKTRIDSLLKNWDKDLVVFRQKITFALQSKNEEGKNHQDKNEDVAELVSLHTETYGQTNADNLLYELLITCPGSRGPHSFKFALLAGLFNLSTEDQANSHQVVTFFIDELEAIKDRERKAFAREMVQSIQAMDEATFILDLNQALALKKMDVSYINPIYAYTLMLRHASALDTQAKVKTMRKGILDAAYDLFKMPVAQEGSHSFKFIFLLHLFGYRLKSTIKDPRNINHHTMHACLTIPEAKKNSASRFLISVFAKGNKDEASFIIKELISEMEQVRKKIETNRHIQVSRFVEQCFRGEIAKQEFIEGLSAARTKKESEEALKSAASPEVIKFFSNIVNGKKITDRKQQLDEIIQRLTLPTTNMLKELITFLDEGAGSNGPHSFKYHLLKKLFPDLNTDIKVTEIESVATIELFIKLGKNRLTQTLDAVPLSAVSKDDVEHSEESSESGRNLLKH